MAVTPPPSASPIRMLTELRISNFALIGQVSLQFTSGFQVLTGETGAGKSILVDAIGLLVGGRAVVDQIRADAEEAVVEGRFSIAQGPLLDALRADGLLGEADSDLVVRRAVSRSGRHRIYLNGGLAPLHLLQRLAGTLIDIHGQHEQQSLLSPKAQLDALDALGQLKDTRRDYTERYERWMMRRRELEDHERSVAERREREEFLRFQHRELADADLHHGEDEALETERHRLTHGRRLAELAGEAYEVLYGADAAVLTGLGIVAERLKSLRAIDSEATVWTTLCDGAAAQLRELAHSLRSYQEALEQDPERLAQIEDRLDAIQRLKKKHGTTVAGLLQKRDEITSQLDALLIAGSRGAELKDLVDGDAGELARLADRISASRQRTAELMEKRMHKELAALRMQHTRFHVQVATPDGAELGATGRDRVEFLLSANPGEPLMSLSKVASGGELSRIMLAMKTVLAKADTVPVLVFDEVDAGVGGAVAAAMGQRLRALSDHHQVFCITHLPQIASQATSHFLVSKAVEKKRTVTRITRLDSTSRRDEIARMLGGLTITQSARKTASEMMGEADGS
ncbi:MAG TPA: DNA repair protein RecN [Nitrospiraceae bacterium]|nr:DNA repair protein RecN [Nitrospiraceae bacterium]